MVEGEVDCAVYDSFVIHFDEVGFADFLVVGNGVFAVGTGDFKYVASTDSSAIGVFEYGGVHLLSLS